jgi:mannose-1-phosphate guanylyltransferase
MAAGLGTRLRPLTDTVPKCLVPVGGRPLLRYWIDRLAEAGVRDAVINTHHLPAEVREFIAEVNTPGSVPGGFQLRESYEPKLLGSAGTISANRALADGASEIVVVYSDNLSGVDLGDMIRFHRSHADPFTMLVFRAAEPRRCGIAECDADNRIIGFVEKPSEPRSDLANGGVYVIDPDAFREIADMRAFDIGFDVIPRFVGRMRAWEWGGYHLDIGTHEALARAESDIGSGVFKLQAGRA